MRQYLVQVEESACEKFEGMIDLCPDVKIVGVDVVIDTKDVVDQCMVDAIRALREDMVFKRPSDYAYIMLAANEEVIKGLRFFYSPKEYIEYLCQLEIDGVPGRTTIYDAIARTHGRYPNWTFTDHPSETEILRRKNVVKRFLSAYTKAKFGVSDGFSEYR